MRGVIFGFLSILALPTFALGYVLHVGDRTFVLSQTKYTTPSLAFGVPNDGVWYAPLSSNEIPNTLKLKVADTTYSVCEPFVDTENYTYDENGRLIDADENLYLKATGTQYIDTTYIANPNTKVYADYKMNTKTAQQYIFGRYESGTQNKYLCFAGYIGNGSTWRECSYNNVGVSGHNVASADIKRHQILLSAKNHIEYWTDVNYTNVSNKSTWTGAKGFGIFANGGGGARSNMNLYRLTIWNSDVIVHDFVPVPACLRIGNFVAPSNGLFDITNQVFYSNDGTGEFIYGKD